MSKKNNGTPAYIQNILKKNEELWQLEDNSILFQNKVEEWIGVIKKQLVTLRGDKKLSPLISVVIPAYNEEVMILACLYALSMQRGIERMEVIVVANNCSKEDRTVEFAHKCGVEVVSYSFQDNRIKPIPYARQRGLEMAKGEIIVSTDADALPMSDWISQAVEPLVDDASVACTTTNIHHYDRETSSQIMNHDNFRTFMRSAFQWTALVALGNNMAFRKRDAMKIGGYNLGLYPGEDVDIGFRLTVLSGKKMLFLENPDSSVWVSPRRVRLFGGGLIMSRMNWHGAVLNARESFKSRRKAIAIDSSEDSMSVRRTVPRKKV